ncbi:MAG: HD domain-containing protein [Clostridia bacterium]|nr:HD domain-containing protein [Clostridia bacterium]
MSSDTDTILKFLSLLNRVPREQKKTRLEEGEILRLEHILAYDQVIEHFSNILGMKSPETGEHVRRVADYTACLCRKMEMAPDVIHDISVASMLHDIGKYLIPNEILEKRGFLTDSEIAVLRMHVLYGDHILSGAKSRVMRLARDIAREHHERWDGSGYALGKSGTEIAPAARIVAVADVFDALTGQRSYKEPWTPEAARAEIAAKSGSQFDPEVVKVFENCFPEILDIREEYRFRELRTA